MPIHVVRNLMDEGIATVRTLSNALSIYVEGADWDCVAETDGEPGCGHCIAMKALKQAEAWLESICGGP